MQHREGCAAQPLAGVHRRVSEANRGVSQTDVSMRRVPRGVRKGERGAAHRVEDRHAVALRVAATPPEACSDYAQPASPPQMVEEAHRLAPHAMNPLKVAAMMTARA